MGHTAGKDEEQNAAILQMRLFIEQKKSLAILVSANAKQTAVCSYDNAFFKIRICEAAEKNKANEELVRFLSRLLHKRCVIVSGHTSKRKIVRCE